MAENKNLSQTRKNVINAIEIAEEEQRRKIEHAEEERKRRRLELARAGMTAYQKQDVVTAVKNYRHFLRSLEEAKNVIPGGLLPSSFDAKKELADILMISGIYWDLAKIYDRTGTVESQKEFYHYLEKYIVFSKGMSFQPVCSESIRKYIQNEKPIHRKEFANAYKLLSVSNCFVVTSLVDVVAPDTMPTLWEFRDNFLSHHILGRHFIRWYYLSGPSIAAKIDTFPDSVRTILGKTLDRVASWIVTLKNDNY